MAISVDENTLQHSLNTASKTTTTSSTTPQTKQHSLAKYQTVDRLLNLPITKNSVALYDSRIEPFIARLPLGSFALRTTKSVIELSQTRVIVPLANRFVEPYHDTVDAAGLKVLDTAEYAGSVAVSVELSVLSGVDGAVSVVERIVDYVLPGEHSEDDEDDQDKDQEETRQTTTQPFQHACAVGLKTGHRLYSLVAKVAPSEHTINLRTTLDVLNQYIAHLQEASNKLRDNLAQSQQFLSEAVEKRVPTKEEREKMLDTTKQYMKPTIEMVLAVQHKLVESAAEVKAIIVALLHSLVGRLEHLPFGVKDKVEVLVNGFKDKYEKLSLQLASPVKKVSENGGTEEVDTVLSQLRQLTTRATDLNALSAEGLEIMGRVRGVVDSYYTYYLKGADKALSKKKKQQ